MDWRHVQSCAVLAALHGRQFVLWHCPGGVGGLQRAERDGGHRGAGRHSHQPAPHRQVGLRRLHRQCSGQDPKWLHFIQSSETSAVRLYHRADYKVQPVLPTFHRDKIHLLMLCEVKAIWWGQDSNCHARRIGDGRIECTTLPGMLGANFSHWALKGITMQTPVL